MLRVETDPTADAIYIQLLAGGLIIDHTEELDINRLIDRTIDGLPVGIDLSSVSHGVNLTGLPEVALVKSILEGLGIRTY